MKHLICTIFLLISINTLFSQNTRISNYNNIGWYGYFGNFKLDKKWSIHTEYQWRRDDYISYWQQSLMRLGLNYQIHPKVQLRAGYAWIETFPYGEIPLNGMGKDFTEHRLYEMATINDKVSILELSHRFMLEQRFVGRYSNATLNSEDEFPFLNRMRYMLRLQIPLKGNEIKDKTPYLATYDEVLVGFGNNVNENVFDQNRFGFLFGYRFNSSFRLEGGFLSQIVQLGREVNGRNVFQYNNGLVINSNFNFDLSKKPKKD